MWVWSWAYFCLLSNKKVCECVHKCTMPRFTLHLNASKRTRFTREARTQQASLFARVNSKESYRFNELMSSRRVDNGNAAHSKRGIEWMIINNYIELRWRYTHIFNIKIFSSHFSKNNFAHSEKIQINKIVQCVAPPQRGWSLWVSLNAFCSVNLE